MDTKPRKYVTRKRIPCNEGAMAFVAPNRPAINIILLGTDGFVIGRSDAKTNYTPDVDLAPYQALEHGMSRRHAALVRYQNCMHLIDLGSVNGTFLNGERLSPDTPHPLHIGDAVGFGDLTVTVEYGNKYS